MPTERADIEQIAVNKTNIENITTIASETQKTVSRLKYYILADAIMGGAAFFKMTDTTPTEVVAAVLKFLQIT